MARQTREIADGVVNLNYPYLNQNIGVIVGRDEVAVIDTRSSPGQAREILEDVRRITKLPVRVVIDTHGHADHAFGNNLFRPAVIWGQAGCPRSWSAPAKQARRDTMNDLPEGGGRHRSARARPAGPAGRGAGHDRGRWARGRAAVPGSGAYGPRPCHSGPRTRTSCSRATSLRRANFRIFGDAFPLDFPATVAAIGALGWDTLVTGHGGLADRDYLAYHENRVRTLVEVARRAHAAGVAGAT